MKLQAPTHIKRKDIFLQIFFDWAHPSPPKAPPITHRLPPKWLSHLKNDGVNQVRIKWVRKIEKCSNSLWKIYSPRTRRFEWEGEQNNHLPDSTDVFHICTHAQISATRRFKAGCLLRGWTYSKTFPSITKRSKIRFEPFNDSITFWAEGLLCTQSMFHKLPLVL
jgi:hypothetical protein